MPPSSFPSRRASRLRITAALGALALLACACGGAEGHRAAAAERVDLRLGYLPTITAAPALVGIADGLFADALGADVHLTTTPFTDGARAVEALFSSAVDVAYVGPNPAINAHAQSDGAAIRVVAGSAAGGASLVVRRGIDDSGDLRGARLATPQLGNTQDVALRSWLADEGLGVDTAGDEDVEVVAQDSALTLDAFRAGTVDGAWMPEPWASRLVLEGDGQVLVDERDLWPGGRFPSSLLVVRTAFLAEHPSAVAGLVAGHVAALRAVQQHPETAKAATNAGIAAVVGAPLAGAVLDRAWDQLTFTVDPLPAALRAAADDAVRVGLLEPVDLTGLLDDGPLRAALAAPGPASSALGGVR